MAGTWGRKLQSGLVEPQNGVTAVLPITADGDQSDIHPMRRGGVKSFVDDLVLGRGVVISRAATSLRTVETQPWTRRFVRNRRTIYLRQSSWSCLQAVSRHVCGRWARCWVLVLACAFMTFAMQVRLLPRALIFAFVHIGSR